MFKWLREKFLTIFGRIKISKYPMWFSYSPTTFLAKGRQFREAVEVLQPGYVIGRGYTDYLDGYFIPGQYSHTGICVKNSEWEQSMIHAMSVGVFQQDLVDFLRCDRFIIFKPRKDLKKAVRIAKSLVGRPYDFDFKTNNKAYYCHELTAYCFPNLKIEQMNVMFGKKAYTIDSFINSPDFEVVYEFDPRKEKFGCIRNC